MVLYRFYLPDVFYQVCRTKTPEDIHKEYTFNDTVLDCIDDWTIVMYSHGDVTAWNLSETSYQVTNRADK